MCSQAESVIGAEQHSIEKNSGFLKASLISNALFEKALQHIETLRLVLASMAWRLMESLLLA